MCRCFLFDTDCYFLIGVDDWRQSWLEPSKQWVHILHFGRPMASTMFSMELKRRDVSFRRRRISSTIRLYSGEPVVA